MSKTYSEFVQIDEAIPLALGIPAASKALGAAMTAAGAYGLSRNLMRSNKAKPTEVVSGDFNDRSPTTGRRMQNVTPGQKTPKSQPKTPTSSSTKRSRTDDRRFDPNPRTRVKRDGSRDKIAPMGPRYRTIPDRPGTDVYQPGSTRKLIDITTGSHPSGIKGVPGKPPFRRVSNVTPQAARPKLPGN